MLIQKYRKSLERCPVAFDGVYTNAFQKMVVIGVHNNLTIIHGWCKSVESLKRDFHVTFLWRGADSGEIVVWCWYHNSSVKWRTWMPKRIDLAADRFLYVSLYKMQTSKGLIAVLHFYSPVYFYNTCIKFYITGLHLEICLK